MSVLSELTLTADAVCCVHCAGPSSSAGGRGRETRDWKGPGLSARQMSLSKPKTLRVSLTAAVTL